jgi:hypothetical protein
MVPPGESDVQRRRRRWGGLGPFLIKVEEETQEMSVAAAPSAPVDPDEFVEEVVEPPARVRPPVITTYFLFETSPPGLFLDSWRS